MNYQMVWDDPEFITEADLGIAYRKMKADLFYESTSPHRQELCDYEKNLAENLHRLHTQLHSGKCKWMFQSDFLGTWTTIPKSIKPDIRVEAPDGHCLHSDPADQWQAAVAAPGVNKQQATFRMTCRLSIDFHLIATLWILKVGHIYDATLGEDAYGSRLRRNHSDNPERPGAINTLSLGTFKPYLNYYRQWRERGLAAMEAGLEDKKRVVAVTADLQLFYHSLSPKFLLDEKYLSKMEIELNPDEKRFTKILIRALRTWAKHTPLHQEKPEIGLPVGLGASSLIANVALAELDRKIREELQPLYYGRYVDDIILVFENSKKFANITEVWNFLESRTDGLLKVSEKDGDKDDLAIAYVPEYLKGSNLKFMGSKQKVFLLSGESGKILVQSIRKQINDQASEWRRLPEMEGHPESIATQLIIASGDDGKAVDSLRKTDDLSLSRAGFAICLRDFEAFEQDLEPSSWKKQRTVFFDTVCRHFLSLPKLFNFAPYISRLFGLAIACRDYENGAKMLKCLNGSLERIKNDCNVALAGGQKNAETVDPLLKWQENLFESLQEALVASLLPSHKKDLEDIGKILDELSRFAGTDISLAASDALRQAKKWSFSDLARRPFRMRFMPYVRKSEYWELLSVPGTGEVSEKNVYFRGLPWSGVQSFCQTLGLETIKEQLLPAMLLPTRPFSVGEMFMLLFGKEQAAASGLQKIPDWTLAFRGFKAEGDLPRWYKSVKRLKREDMLCIPNEQAAKKKLKIALGCLETRDKSWKAAACADPEPDPTRYIRLNRLVNSAIASSKRPDYLVLPELSVPARWFSRIAAKLAQNKISLVAGVDYIHHGRKRVANQAWASLISDFVGFPVSIIYRQDKFKPAHHEECNLWRVAGVRPEPLVQDNRKPVIVHGEFHFAILICSELTNIRYRAKFRGKVDAVLIPEWNKDAKSFAALVESSALDIHAYIIQCNDRKYGDSRIRAPYKNNWQRDVVRVKGGIEDFIVIGEVDTAALRLFQRDHRSSPEGPFKPIPDGFKLAISRKPSL